MDKNILFWKLLLTVLLFISARRSWIKYNLEECKKKTQLKQSVFLKSMVSPTNLVDCWLFFFLFFIGKNVEFPWNKASQKKFMEKKEKWQEGVNEFLGTPKSPSKNSYPLPWKKTNHWFYTHVKGDLGDINFWWYF